MNTNNISLLANRRHKSQAQTSRHRISKTLRATVKIFGVEVAISAVFTMLTCLPGKCKATISQGAGAHFPKPHLEGE